MLHSLLGNLLNTIISINYVLLDGLGLVTIYSGFALVEIFVARGWKSKLHLKRSSHCPLQCLCKMFCITHEICPFDKNVHVWV